ncbi:MAG TPA: cysteine--tRNA ligase [Candidatus Limnocylindrales bacterium]
MTLRLRNTLTRLTEPVRPIEPGRIAMYSCGPTVYSYAHVGNLRSYLLADLIRRALLYHGLDVFHVQNITDVGHLRDERFDRGEDRMLVAAGLESKTPAEIATAYEAAFHADAALVNILPAHAFPRATEHIGEMIALAERLQDGGHAYLSPAGNLYFAVATFPGYGRLSGNSLDELRAGARGEVEPDKRDPADFALWKRAGEGRLLRWPTPRWGDGFPGWHLECSAMATRYLGPEFDIHTGGVDNVFPHHEDEIAQSASLSGRIPARHWVHGEHLLQAGRKMAKSAGNLERITDLVADGIDPLAFRYLALMNRYRHKLAYSRASVTAAGAGLASLRELVAALGPAPAEGPWLPAPALTTPFAGPRPMGIAQGIAGHGSTGVEPPIGLDRAHEPSAPLSEAGRELHRRFVAAIDDDLDTAAALRVVREIARAHLPIDERRWLILDADFILGLDLDRAPVAESDPRSLDAAAAALIAERGASRVAGDYARADRLRAELRERGIELTDDADGTTHWRWTSR